MKAMAAARGSKRTETLMTGWSDADLSAWLEMMDDSPQDPPERADALLPSGERYTLGEELGRGGMGSVVLARDNLLGRTVAMKRLIKARPNLEELQRFLQEAQVTGQLEHPNIVDVHEVGVDAEGRPYFTMQYVRGNESLETVIERLRAGDPSYHRRYSFERRVQIVEQVARAVQFAHERGVLHRDIKPANIMVGPFGEVLLLDWGLSRIKDAQQARVQNPQQSSLPERVAPVSDPVHTDPDGLLGTPFYMAPEQITDDVEERSDVYALTAVLFELLSLEHYLGHPSRELEVLVRQILSDEPQRADASFDAQNGRVPAALAQICADGLTKDPDARIQSAELLADRLQAWLEGHCEVGCPNSLNLSLLRSWKRALENHPGPATLISLAAAALCLVSVAFTLGHAVGAL